eukprot:CAMPEP_0185778140 /NCGR_PEP_ID=MMETSP1174-20130828/91638_1 /TAXON_ID=35687 /ORGANISM="Dictyocha speculum, Strain CCMP1381" /LENGTH=400 /DNA_ID=CAMNT_0028466751 /DNA_START=250 /DNA_END=1452 /DNA_ORIENTATION=-
MNVREIGRTVIVAADVKSDPEGNEEKPPKRKEILGTPHTEESKAKISAANKGNVPWNKGKSHSEETRRKIAATLKAKAAKAKAAKHAVMLTELNITNEEWTVQEEEKKKMPRNNTLSEGVRKKISDALKLKWENPEYRAHMRKIQKEKPTRMHSDETRMKISQTLKKKWETNETYRSIVTERAGTQSSETRAKISATLRARWEDESFREKMANISRSPRTKEHRQHISDAVKAKWEDEEYRERTIAGIRKANGNRTVRPRASRKPRTTPKSTSVRRRKVSITVRGKRDDIPEPAAPRRTRPKRTVTSMSSKSTSGNSGVKKVKPAKKAGSKKGKVSSSVSSSSVSLSSSGKQRSPEDMDRIERLKVSDPHLWAALYDDDDDWGLPTKLAVKKSRSERTFQ